MSKKSRPKSRPKLQRFEKRHQLVERRKTKLLTPYRPADAPIFISATVGEELKESIQKILDEELSRIDMKVKCVETGGVESQVSVGEAGPHGLRVPGLHPVRLRAQGRLPHPERPCVHRDLHPVPTCPNTTARAETVATRG